MRLVQVASSVARLPVFFLERGLSVAGAAARLVGRVAGGEGGPPAETVWPPPEREPAGFEPEVVAPEPELEDLEPELVEPDPAVLEPEPAVIEPEPEVVEPEPPEPPHVSEEPVLVAELAETGVEDGAGPELRIDEPWEGYSSMTATEIRRRLRQADAATVAAVRLYEAAHKGRSTVLQAAAAASATLSG